MAGRERPKNHRGRHCWCCGRTRANERFSGKGHARHLCKDCQKLGRPELEVRQRERDIDLLMEWDGRIKKKRYGEVERFLEDRNPRIRAYAEEMIRQDAQIRAEIRDMYKEETAAADARWLALGEERDPRSDDYVETTDLDDAEIPF